MYRYREQEVPLDKVIRDGKVAVLVSPGFGGGWYTENREYPASAFDPEIVALVESGADAAAIQDVAERKWPDGYWGSGAADLIIRWVDEGTRFYLKNYDGYESLILEKEHTWLVA